MTLIYYGIGSGNAKVFIAKVVQRNLASNMMTRHIMNDNKGSEVQHHNFITTLTMGADMMTRVPQVHVNSNL